MLSPDKPSYDDAILIRYLVGGLPEDETERLDELSVADDDFASRLQAVENDLLDGYVRGQLAGETLDRFRASYLSSPQRLEKVRFAEALVRSGARPAVAAVRGRRVLAFPVRWAVAAAALLVVAGSAYLLLNRQRPDREPSRAAREPKTASFVLLAQTRSAGSIATIAPPQGTGLIQLELELEAGDFAKYAVALKDPAAGQVLWRSEPVKAASTGDSKTVSVSFPTALLRTQNYTVELSGLPAGGGPELVSTYAFRAVIR